MPFQITFREGKSEKESSNRKADRANLVIPAGGDGAADREDEIPLPGDLEEPEHFASLLIVRQEGPASSADIFLTRIGMIGAYNKSINNSTNPF